MSFIKVVLIIIFDTKTQKILSERRSPNHPAYPNQLTFPTGKVDKKDNDKLDNTLLREVKEELGIIPTKYALLSNTPIQGSKQNTLLYPFLITEWNGTIPKTILDKGNELVWESLDEVAASPISTRPKFVQLIKNYLISHQE